MFGNETCPADLSHVSSTVWRGSSSPSQGWWHPRRSEPAHVPWIVQTCGDVTIWKEEAIEAPEIPQKALRLWTKSMIQLALCCFTSDIFWRRPHMATYGHIQPLPLFCGKPSWLCPKKVLFATKQSATQLPSLAIWLEHPWRSSRHQKKYSRCCARSGRARHQLDPWQCQRCPKWKSQSARSPRKRPPSSPRRKRAH